MVRYENECVGCPPEIGCLGDVCPNRNVPRFYCDECKFETDELWTINGYEVCEDCLKKMFPKVIA